MTIHQTARFKVKRESLAKCEQAIREFVEYIKANEPDTLLYTAMQQTDDAASFLHYFIFKDEAARAALQLRRRETIHFDLVPRMSRTC